MTLIRQKDQNFFGPNSIQKIMKLVFLGILPGLAIQTVFFGWGTFINIIWCIMIALISEAIILKIRKKPLMFYLSDGSAIITGVLLALALPPCSPWWLTLIGVSFAIIIGKQLYGGLGNNLFNPAMLGYVLLIISFPQEMTKWLPPAKIAGHPVIFSFIDTINSIFPFFGQGINIDAISMATPLDIVRTNNDLTMKELWSVNPILQYFGGHGWINIAYLMGGLFLIYRKVTTWHSPVGMLIALLIMSTLFWGGTGSSSKGSPLFHLFSGATMLGAFFIISDPVSNATSNKGRFIFGLWTGILVYIIRVWGSYPDGVAFVTLLMNMAAPMLDYYTQPRTYGHKKPNKGLPKTN